MEKKVDYEKVFQEYQKELPYMTLEQFSQLLDPMKDSALRHGELERKKTRVVAEVVDLKGSCVAGYKLGDKLVFTPTGMLLAEESTTKVACAWLLRNLIPVFAANEALMTHDIDLDPMLNFTMEPCADPGPPTGFGTVKVKLRVVSSK